MEQSAPKVFEATSTEHRKSVVIKNQTKITHPGIVPDSLLHNEFLNDLVSKSLPKNYNFEVHKTIWKIKQTKANKVVLQLPEGLIRFGPILVDIFTGYFTHDGTEDERLIRFVIMGDLTYGACCIDDYLARSMGCDLIVHYAHSCLVPIKQLSESVKYLYVFLDIKFHLDHMISCVKHNFQPEMHKIALASTIQFVASVHEVAKQLRQANYDVTLPQSRPLSSAEVLGCTAPKLNSDIDTIIFICDGRFHLEALMIANPDIAAYRYDPYSRKLTHETYEFDQMYAQRMGAIERAADVMRRGGTIGFVLGTLGRQGNEGVYKRMIDRLKTHTKCDHLKMLMPEVVQETLEAVEGVEIWVQVACPRLSIDWGSSFRGALLNPYEFAQSIKILLGREKSAADISERNYPMDFYAKNSAYDHTPNHCCSNNTNCACATLA